MEYDTSKFKGLEVSFGFTGIKLFDNTEIGDAQLGYSIHPSGESLTGSEEGDWKDFWLVIGHTTDCGDPIFVDISTKEMEVFTAIHGRGYWSPTSIAKSYSGFLAIMDKFAELSIGREYPTRLDSNPMTQTEFDKFISFASDAAEISDTLF